MICRHSSSDGMGIGHIVVPTANDKCTSSERNADPRIRHSFFPSQSKGGTNLPIVIESLHQVVGASDGRGHPALTQAENAVGRGGNSLRAPAATVEPREPVSPRASSLSRRAGWHRLKAVSDQLADSILGDVTGLGCIVAITLIFIFVTP